MRCYAGVFIEKEYTENETFYAAARSFKHRVESSESKKLPLFQSPVSSSNFAVLPLTVRRGSTSLQADSLGVGLNEHFLTYGFLAPSPVLTKAPSTPSTAAKSKRSAENMVNEYVS